MLPSHVSWEITLVKKCAPKGWENVLFYSDAARRGHFATFKQKNIVVVSAQKIKPVALGEGGGAALITASDHVPLCNQLISRILSCI